MGEFRSIRREGLLYVDKTRHMANLLRPEYKYVFLARPRRFGKTLLVSTLEALLQGERALFTGTWIEHQDRDWQPRQVIRLDLSELSTQTEAALENSLCDLLLVQYEEYGLPLPTAALGSSRLLARLVQGVAREGQVVVLIDEYDAPILRNLARPDQLFGIRELLRAFYAVLKARERDLHFVFLTGVTRFARTTIFSGLNNLADISPHRDFSDLTGFTQTELDQNLAPYMTEMARVLDVSSTEIRQNLQHWYDGYLFAPGGQRVYNPFSTLQALSFQSFGNYWADSGTPYFLTRLMAQRKTDLQELIGQPADQLATATYNLERPHLAAVMFQTGYLTLQASEAGAAWVTAFPNREVELTFVEALLGEYTQSPDAAPLAIADLIQSLQALDGDTFFARCNALLRQIPYEIQGNRHRYFQLVLHLIFVLLRNTYEPGSELSTHRGRIDTVIEWPERTVILEYKVDASAQKALTQIAEKGYADAYLDAGKEVIGIGVNFDSRLRQATEWKMRRFSLGPGQ